MFSLLLLNIRVVRGSAARPGTVVIWAVPLLRICRDRRQAHCPQPLRHPLPAATSGSPADHEIFHPCIAAWAGRGDRRVLRQGTSSRVPCRHRVPTNAAQVLALLDRLSGTISQSFFFQHIWLVMLTTPRARGTSLSYLSKRLPTFKADEGHLPGSFGCHIY